MVSAGELAALGAAVLGLVLVQMPWQTLYMMATSESQVVCRRGMATCGDRWDGSTVGNPGRALVPHFLQKMLLRRPSALIVVGPSEDPTRDLAFWTPLIWSTWTVILVDANPYACYLLWEKYKSQKNVHVVNAILTDNSSENSTVPFHMFSPKVAEEFPNVSVPILWYANSLNRSWLEDTHRLAREGRNAALNTNFTAAEWEAMLRHVESVDVKTMTPAALLERASVAPSAVDVLMTDAEGADSEIVTAFLGVPSFAPKVIKFEYKIGDVLATSHELMQRLHYQHGYTLAVASEFDMMAMHEG